MMQARLQTPTNEAFADLSALFLHFTHKEILVDTLRKTGGRLFDFKLKPDAPSEDGSTGRVIRCECSIRSTTRSEAFASVI
jgi:hypothetical protein